MDNFKNNFTEKALSSWSVTNGDSFYWSQYNGTSDYSVSNSQTPAANQRTVDIKIPYDLIIFGRYSTTNHTTMDSIIKYETTPSRSDINNMFTYSNKSTNFGIGLHPIYNEILTRDQNSIYSPLVCSYPIANTQWIPMDYFHNKIPLESQYASNNIYKNWGHNDRYRIKTTLNKDLIEYLSVSACTITDNYEVLGQEIIVDNSYYFYVVALVKYTFKPKICCHRILQQLGTTIQSNKQTPMINPQEINLLVSFKYSHDFKFHGIEILNENLTLGSSKLPSYSYPEATSGNFSWEFSYNLNSTQWISPIDYASQPRSYVTTRYPYKQTNGTFPIGDKSKNTNLIQPFYFYPTEQTNSSIQSFTTVYNNATNKYNIIYRKVDGTTRILELGNTRRTMRFGAYEKDTFYSGDFRDLAIRNTSIPETWSVNPSGSITASMPVTDFPISVTNFKNISYSIYGHSSVLNKIYLNTVTKSISVSTNNSTYVTSYANIPDTIKSRELNICGITYTTNSRTFYITYILTDSSIYIHVFNKTINEESVKIFRINKNNIYRIRTTDVFATHEYNIINNDNNRTRVFIDKYLPTISIVVYNQYIYTVKVTFKNTELAQAAFEKKDIWKVFIGDAEVIIKKCDYTSQSTIVYFELDLLTYQQNNPGSLTVVFTVFGVDSYLPYILSTGGVLVDARPLALGNLKFELGGVEYPMLTSEPSGVIHTTSAVFDSGYKIISTGITDNVKSSILSYTSTNSNWFKFHSSSEKFTDTAALNASVPDNFQLNGIYNNQFLISGIMLNVSNYINNKATYYIPTISVYDDHKFIIGKIYSDNIVEIDSTDDSSINKPVNRGGAFYPKFNDNNTYIFKFNFRCGPNYLNSNGKYTINYINNPTHPVESRITTPMIKQWWIIGIPKSVYHSCGICVATEYDNPSIITDANANILHNDGLYYYNFYPYINDSSVDFIYTKINNPGVVRCSGYYSVPSGYIDLHNITFTTTFDNQTLVNGVVPNGAYKIYFIVEDTLGHKTGIDLIYLSEPYSYDGKLPPSSYFTYGV